MFEFLTKVPTCIKSKAARKVVIWRRSALKCTEKKKKKKTKRLRPMCTAPETDKVEKLLFFVIPFRAFNVIISKKYYSKSGALAGP